MPAEFIDFTLPYGKSEVSFRLPERNVLKYTVQAAASPIDNPEDELLGKLSNPLGCPKLEKVLTSNKKVLLVCDDYTRPTPANLLLPPLLDYLNKLGIKDSNIRILVAAGFHREMSGKELISKYGKEAVERIAIHYHNAKEQKELAYLGETSQKVPVWINRRVIEADYVIGIGVVEIHPWAGFAGGPKIIMPGVAGKKTIDFTHSLPVVAKGVKVGETRTNPFWNACKEAAELNKLDLVINVVLNEKEELCGIFCGHFVEAQQAAISFFKKINEFVYEQEADVVIASANPKYHYWGQSSISIINAGRIIKQGGTRIILSACPEDFGDDISEKGFYYYSLSKRWKSLEEYWEFTRGRENCNSRNACAIYRHLELLQHSRCIVVSRGYPQEMLPLANLDVVSDINETLPEVLQGYGREAKIAVIPLGGMVLPTVKSKAGGKK